MGERSNSYIGILLGSLSLVAGSAYFSTVLNSIFASFLVHVFASITLYITSHTLLSFTAAEQWRLEKKSHKSGGKLRPFQYGPRSTATFVTRVTGSIAGAYVIALPFISWTDDPIAKVSLRIPCFFYACKCWDLTVARVHKPPIPRNGKDELLYGLVDWKAHIRYVWWLLTEFRYASFDIAVDESRRKSLPTSTAWTYGPLAILPLTYLFPIAELKILSGLLGVQFGFEALHKVVHFGCPNAVFHQPFAARSLEEFWSCHWHHGAQSLLHSLGYVPARTLVGKTLGRNAGRAAGVLAAFSLSGIWHAWSGAVLTRDEYAWTQSLGLWAVFMLQGIGLLVERSALRDKKWGRGWRRRVVAVLCWGISVESASIWLRYAEPRAKLPQGWTSR